MAIFSCRFILDLREAIAPADDSAELTGVTNGENTGILFVPQSPDHSTNVIASSVYATAVLWTSDDMLSASLSERIEEV